MELDRRTGLSLGLHGAVVFTLLLVCPIGGRAAEPATEFLDALRSREYYDTALDYLEQMRASPLAPVALKQVIDYERGATLVMAASTERDLPRREQMLDDAQKSLRDFLQKSPNHRMAEAARNQLGNLLTVRGKMQVELSKQQNKPELLTAARGHFDAAYKNFSTTIDLLKGRLEAVTKQQYDPKTQQELIDHREQMFKDYLQAQLLRAIVLEETAATASGKEQADLLNQAAKEYQAFEEKYRLRLSALYAKVYRGRCMAKLKKYGDALVLYREILEENENSPEFRELKAMALKLAFDCWMDPSQKGYAEAVDRGGAWRATLRPAEARQPDALELQYLLALANKHLADMLREKDPSNRLINERLRVARELAVEVSREPSAVQAQARQLIADMRGVALPEPAERPQPKTFVEAKDAGKDALDAMQNAAFLVETLPARLAKETEPDIKAEVKQQLAEAEQRVKTKRAEAADYFRRALSLADAESSLEDINMVRLYLAHLLYFDEQYYDAALLADFVARRYPADASAREAARISLASYAKLYSTAPEDQRDFERAHVEQLCEYILQQWPDQPIAADAWNALIPFVAEKGQMDRVLAGLEKVPADSPQRGDLELKLGRALWSEYRQGLTELRRWEREGVPPDVQLAEHNAQLEKWKTEAQRILTAGVERARKASGSIDLARALAVLYLAQVYVDGQQAAKAIEVLEDPAIGPLSLVRSKHEAASAPGFAEETYRTALRAYLGAIGGAASEQAIEKAKAVMADLKASVGSDAEGQKRLVAVYVALARELKSQMELASADERKALAEGFVTFLGRVGSESRDFQVQNWVAETFYSMAESFDQPQSSKAPAAAATFYTQALTAYDKILSDAAADASFLPAPELTAAIDVRTALIRRRLGQYKEAMETFRRVLSEKNMMLSVQVEAARTFQMGAAAPGFDALYQKAIMGDYLDRNQKPPANIIWGWGKISKLTSGRKEFQEVFFESRYNLALCRFEMAQHTKDADKKQRYLDLAKQDVVITARLYPELGGEAWAPKFDALLKRMQQARGEPAVGLTALATANTSK